MDKPWEVSVCALTNTLTNGTDCRAKRGKEAERESGRSDFKTTYDFTISHQYASFRVNQ